MLVMRRELFRRVYDVHLMSRSCPDGQDETSLSGQIGNDAKCFELGP